MKNRENRQSSGSIIGKARDFSFSDPSFVDEVSRLLRRAGFLSSPPIVVKEKRPASEQSWPHSRFR